MERNPARRKLRAYELVRKKFDDFVSRVSSRGLQQRGLIIHDPTTSPVVAAGLQQRCASHAGWSQQVYPPTRSR